MSGDGDNRTKRHGPLALSLAAFAAFMVGLSFAAVPLYRMFCEATGYGGVPQRAESAPGEVLDRKIKVRFDANVDPALAWSFKPTERSIDVKIGDTALTFFKAENSTDKPIGGTANFNVVPEQAGRYFTKIECFCFKQQTLASGQSVEMPVTFFVDPKIVEDEDTKNISEITLSYTFYRSDEPGVAAAPAESKRSGS